MALRKENPLPQFKVASYKCLGIRLSFKDPTTLLPGGRGEGRIGRLRRLEKMPPKYAIFSTVLSKIVDDSVLGIGSFRPKGQFARWQFAQTTSTRPICICRSLSLRKRNKHGKTVTAHVESKVN